MEETTEIIVLDPVELNIQATGELVTSNFGEFEKYALSKIKAINLEPSTDEEFGKAKDDIKTLKTFEDNLKQVRAEIIEKMDSINTEMAGCLGLEGTSKDSRLKLTKAVKTQTEKVKLGILNAGMENIKAVSVEAYRARVQQSMKGRSKLKTMKEAVEKEVIMINAEVSNAHVVIERFTSKHGEKIALDKNKLEMMTPGEIEITLQGRIDKLEAEAKEKAAAEELAKAKAKTVAAEKKAEEANKPPMPPAQDEPPTVSSIPVGSSRLPDPPFDDVPTVDEDAEWDEFKGLFFEALSKTNVASKNLKSARNIQRAKFLKDGVNLAWKGAIA